MKKPVFLALCLLLVACQMEVEYSGEVSAPKLVVYAQYAYSPQYNDIRCYVQQSTFFLDDKPDNRFLSDATVECQINGKTYPFTFYQDSNAYLPPEGMPPASTGDRLTMRVTHPAYGTTSATQTTPAAATCQISDTLLQTDTLSEYIEHADDSSFTVYRTRLQIDLELGFYAYPLLSDDVIEVTAQAVYQPTPDSTYRRKAYLSTSDPFFLSLTADGDMGIIDDIVSLFGDEARRYDAFYIPTQSVRSSKSAKLKIFTPSSRDSVQSVVITTRTMTRDAWLYHASVEQQSNLMGAVIGLGQEEHVQVFGNFEGDVIGIFIASAEQTIMIDFKHPQP